MINRELIRLKVLQLVYAYYSNEGKTLEAAEKEFLFSLDKAYELYHNLLLLMLGISHMAERMVEMQQNRARRLNERDSVSTKFIQNRFIAQLRENRQLKAFQEKQNALWGEEDEFLRRTYQTITKQPFYQEYVMSGESSYEEDRELWRKIYRNVLCNNEELDEILEDNSLYWNDDKTIVDTFVLKTIRKFEEKAGAEQELLPEYKDTEDPKFATTLFRTTIENETYYRQLIRERTLNWELERIAVMDLVIMQIALAEITSFPEIPLSVSINEYVELAKIYSTPRSCSYINGLLDTIAKELIADGKIDK
ncbi:MAG: transcription antitermination factor NusB [Bacteroidaceae bacterium]|nr:transcription antitermination factor NusB [Bacteroidaceae bacterium]